MSGGRSCLCDLKNKKNWKVLHRNHNHSYFEKPQGQEHYSDYSTVTCLACRMSWRTKSDYVNKLKDLNL
jgi:hypothetical protein